MEKIKVNMSPNPLDVQTIHASQNDGEARQWEFELHNNGELIDTSEVTEQLFFKSYKGGTEKLLPENTSTPTTSPFKGDIRYPQGLLTGQEFTYRQSPTEEDGNAKITDIKGNTLVWNQLVQNGNFAENVAWNGFGGTYSYADNVATLTVTSASATQGISAVRTRVQAPANHILLLKLDIKSDNANALFGVSLNTNSLNTNNVFSSKHASTSWETWSAIITPTVNVEGMRIATYIGGLLNVGEKLYLRNVNLIDLTAMFGSGNEPTTVEEFTSLFPLSYYSYNQGSLLSFNGNGIKTVGKNLLKTNDSLSWIPSLTKNEDGSIHVQGSRTSDGAYVIGNITLLANKTYVIKKTGNADCYFQLRGDGQTLASIGRNDVAYTPTQNIECTIRLFARANVNIDFTIYPQIEFGSTSSDYEPYAENTLSLPISTYFPTGMKSVGNVYDELTESKAITRIGAVDLGSLDWTYRTTGSTYAPYFYASFTGIKPNGNPNVRKANILCSKYSTAYRSQDVFIDKTICADGSPTVISQIQIKDSSFTDATAFKTAMSGVYLYYELATPTETSFTTASLVTENAEIPLSNEDGTLIGKCTEQLSENPGFIDAKIKLADSDGECYSNKIQLHVERSPQ